MSTHARNTFLSLSALALAIAFAGCSDRPATPEATAIPEPNAASANQHAVPAGTHEVATTVPEEHSDHSPASTSLPPLPATPWPSDAPLREGMRRTHRAVVALEHGEHGHLDAAQTTAAAQQVQDAANYMIANCKLAPEPDAALHGVLAKLMTGAAAIKADPGNTAPVASMREAISLYPRMFEDATWQKEIAPQE